MDFLPQNSREWLLFFMGFGIGFLFTVLSLVRWVFHLIRGISPSKAVEAVGDAWRGRKDG